MKQHLINTCLKFSARNLCKNINFRSRSFSSNVHLHKPGVTHGRTEEVFALGTTSTSDIQPCLDDELSHIPVMSKEVVEALQPKNNQTILDMTFGAGGHSTCLMNAAYLKLICLDRDPVAYKKAIEFSKDYDGAVTPLLGRFSEIEQVFKSANIEKNSLDGILIDAGCSSMQMDSAVRGFSISKNGPLDMRMDGDSEKRCDKLQRPAHVATRVFQALRIFVNNELNELNYGMEMAYKYLKPGGRLVTLTFHSLEDRIIKRHMLGIDMDEPVCQSIRQKYSNASLWHSQEDIDSLYSNRWTSIYKHVVKPSAEEVSINPRSRSAKLRAAIKNESD